MPTVTLLKRECQKNKLPKVCMKCGEPATVQVRRNFFWFPTGAGFVALAATLIPPMTLLGPLILLTAMKRMVVYAPMCEKHRYHWHRRFAWLKVSGGLIALLSLAAMIFFWTQHTTGGPDKELAVSMCFTCVFLLPAWLLLLIVLMVNVIKPKFITKKDINLVKVHPDFVEAINEWRRNKMFNNYYIDDVADQPKPPGHRPPVRDQADDGPKPRKKKNTPWYDEE